MPRWPVLRARKAMRMSRRAGCCRCWLPIPAPSRTSPHFCETTGHELVESKQDGDVYSFLIRKAA